MSDQQFRQGLHVTGRADPNRVVAQAHGAGVVAVLNRDCRRALASVAMANWVRQTSRPEIKAYQEVEKS